MTLSESGIQALEFWHQSSGFSWTFPETLKRINAINPWFLETLGKAIFGGALSSAEVRDAMQGLARETNGSFPARPVDLEVFFDALLGQVQGITGWTKIVSAVAEDTGKAIAQVGSFALTSAALLAVAALFLYVYMKGKK